MIRPATPADAASICRIYNHYVVHTITTFEEQACTPEEMARRIDNGLAAHRPWLVLVEADEILGYAYATTWKARSAYDRTVETTIYLDPHATGGGHGTALYGALLDALRQRSHHAAIGSIALPNDASLRLHEKLGFHQVGVLREVGRKFDAWIDVACWQLLL